MIIYILLGILAVLVLYFIATYNSLIQLRNKKDTSFSGIDVELKRRADLIPNLVETVKGYAKHESETLENVIKARNTYLTAKTPDEMVDASNQVTGALNKLFALSESYPELKANENFISLQKDLRDTEDKISVARGSYNDKVLEYNNKVEMFPSSIVAKFANFKKGIFFEVNEQEKETPKVSF